MPSRRRWVRGAKRTMRKTLFRLACAALVVSAVPARLAIGEWSPWLGLPPVSDVAEPGDLTKQVELGRRLFLEPHLAEDGVISCSTCHIPEHGFTLNTLPTSSGRGGIIQRRNAPSLLNVSLAKSLFRDGRMHSLEEQIWGPLLNVEEQWNPTIEDVVARLKARPEYDKAFRSAFSGQRVSKQLIGASLAAYERSLVAAGSPFDQWYYGKNEAALTPDARAGFEIFRAGGCSHCHSVESDHATFTDDSYRNTGVEWARVNGKIGVEKGVPDVGRFEVTGREVDRHAFRVPTLRNVALTFPYMHDGSLASLREVVDFYDGGNGDDPQRDSHLRKLNLSKQQKQQLIAFLESLTSANAEALAKQARTPFVSN
jgi:cytochrome c peroxidase